MRYNFKRLTGREWYDLIKSCRARGLTFLEVSSNDLYDRTKVSGVYNIYYYRTTTQCKIIYYEYLDGYKKRLRQISFSPKEADVLTCVLKFKKIAKKHGEFVPYEPHKQYTNGIYTYFTKPYKGIVTVLDMRSAYLYVLSQPLADWQTQTSVTADEVSKREFDFYSFENDIHCEMFYKDDTYRIMNAKLWAGVKIYGYKAKCFYPGTCKELYEMKKNDTTGFYKNVANIAVGCMHKRNGKQNNTTIASSLYAWFQWYMDNIVYKFKKKGYNVVMVTTDSIKIKGLYKEEDNIVPIGEGLGEYKYEYVGRADYKSAGRYTERQTKWKGKPLYMIDGYKRCEFINNIEEELPIYEKYAQP